MTRKKTSVSSTSADHLGFRRRLLLALCFGVLMLRPAFGHDTIVEALDGVFRRPSKSGTLAILDRIRAEASPELAAAVARWSEQIAHHELGGQPILDADDAIDAVAQWHNYILDHHIDSVTDEELIVLATAATGHYAVPHIRRFIESEEDSLQMIGLCSAACLGRVWEGDAATALRALRTGDGRHALAAALAIRLSGWQPADAIQEIADRVSRDYDLQCRVHPKSKFPRFYESWNTWSCKQTEYLAYILFSYGDAAFSLVRANSKIYSDNGFFLGNYDGLEAVDPRGVFFPQVASRALGSTLAAPFAAAYPGIVRKRLLGLRAACRMRSRADDVRAALTTFLRTSLLEDMDSRVDVSELSLACLALAKQSSTDTHNITQMIRHLERTRRPDETSELMCCLGLIGYSGSKEAQERSAFRDVVTRSTQSMDDWYGDAPFRILYQRAESCRGVFRAMATGMAYYDETSVAHRLAVWSALCSPQATSTALSASDLSLCLPLFLPDAEAQKNAVEHIRRLQKAEFETFIACAGAAMRSELERRDQPAVLEFDRRSWVVDFLAETVPIPEVGLSESWHGVLRQFARPIRDFVASQLSSRVDDDVKEALDAVLLLRELDESTRLALGQLLGHDDPSVVVAALRAMEFHGLPIETSTLRHLANRPSSSVRLALLQWALSATPRQLWVCSLMRDDRDSDVRTIARLALNDKPHAGSCYLLRVSPP